MTGPSLESAVIGLDGGGSKSWPSAIGGNMIFECLSLQARTYRKNNVQTQSNSEGLEVSNYSLCAIFNHYSVSAKHIKQYTGGTMVGNRTHVAKTRDGGNISSERGEAVANARTRE